MWYPAEIVRAIEFVSKIARLLHQQQNMDLVVTDLKESLASQCRYV